MYILIVSIVKYMLVFTLSMTAIITLRPRMSICRIFHRRESDVMKRNIFSYVNIDRNDLQKNHTNYIHRIFDISIIQLQDSKAYGHHVHHPSSRLLASVST
jgi:hypothetical protein